MKSLGIVTSLITLAAGLAVALPGAAAATTTACTWRSSPLPVPPGVGEFSINVDGTDHNGGWAGDASVNGDRDHVFSWKNGTVTDLGPTPMAPGQTIKTQATVADENRSGTIVVNLFVSPYQQLHPPYRIRNGQWEALGLLPTTTWSTAVAINDAGDILGTNTVVSNGVSRLALVRWPAGQTTPVEVTGLPPRTSAIDLDEDGTMLVDVYTNGPAIVRGGVLTPLPLLPRVDYASAAKISNGRIIGSQHLKSGYVGAVWERDLTPHSLPNSNVGKLINRDGLAIGTRLTGGGLGVWRNGVLEFSFPSSDTPADMGAISDDGSFAGTLNYLPTVWRCT